MSVIKFTLNPKSLFFVLFICFITVSGCRMNTTTQDPAQNTDPNSIPVLRFVKHNFSPNCFDTYDCKIFYADRTQWFEDDPNEKRLSFEEYGGEAFLAKSGGSHIGIRNFPPPAKVSWRSKDGTPLTAEIDIAEIFSKQEVLHKVKLGDLYYPPEETDVQPTIMLVVNDRNIKVYMRAFISTRSAQIPGNKYSYARNDLMLAYSQDF